MGTNGDDSFEQLLEELTPLQLDWLAKRIDAKSDREASRELEIDKDTPGRWKAEGVPIDEIVRLAKQDGVILVKRRIRADLNWAYDVKREGLKSDSERIRQTASSEILDRGLGKASQSMDISTLGESLNERPVADREWIRELVGYVGASLGKDLLPASGQGDGAVEAEESTAV